MIPKTILQTSALGPDEYIKEQLYRFLDSSWEYIHFTDEEITSYLSGHRTDEFPDILEKFCSMPTGAHKADLFRYFYLFMNGGVFIDYDAMLKSRIDRICSEFDFFTTRSGYVGGVLFQGFMGTTSGNAIIHEALVDAYNQDVDHLRHNYLAMCRALNDIVNRNYLRVRTKLLDEIVFSNGIAEVVDESGSIVLMHFHGDRVVPRISGSPWVPTL